MSLNTVVPSAGPVFAQQLSPFDQALEDLCSSTSFQLMSLMKNENGIVSYKPNNKGDVVEEAFDVPLELPSITITYPVDHGSNLDQVTVTYTNDEVQNVKGMLRVIGEFYDRPLTTEQLDILRDIDLSNEALYVDAEDNHIYNALINERRQCTTLICIEGLNGVYTVDLEDVN